MAANLPPDFWVASFGSRPSVDLQTFAVIYMGYLTAHPVGMYPVPEAVDKVIRYVILTTPPAGPLPASALQVTRDEFDTFLLRFGPLELSFTKAMDALFDGAGNLQPWFHGNCCDAEATRAGEFLVRFSKFKQCLTIVYCTMEGGVLSAKKALIYNHGELGYSFKEPAGTLTPHDYFRSPRTLIEDNIQRRMLSTPVVSLMYRQFSSIYMRPHHAVPTSGIPPRSPVLASHVSCTPRMELPPVPPSPMLRVESLPEHRRSSFDSEDPISRYGFLPESSAVHPEIVMPARGISFPPRSLSEQVSKDTRSAASRPRSPVVSACRRPVWKLLPQRPMQPLEIKDLFLEVYPVIQPMLAAQESTARSPVNVGAYISLPDSEARQMPSERRPSFLSMDVETDMFVEKPLKRQFVDTPPQPSPMTATPLPSVCPKCEEQGKTATAEAFLAKSKPLQDGKQFLLALDFNLSAVNCAREELKAARTVLVRSLANKAVCELSLGRTSAAVGTLIEALKECVVQETPIKIVEFVLRQIVAAAVPLTPEDAAIVSGIVHRLKASGHSLGQLDASLSALLP